MRDKWLWLLFILGTLFYAAWTGFVVAADKPLDYYVYVIAADAFAHGKNIYLSPDSYAPIAGRLGITNYTMPYRYPLLTALLVRPLLLLPLRLGAVVWIFGNGLAALVAALLLGRDADAVWKRRLILAAAIGFVPILTTMYAGQVNGLVLLAAAAALYAWQQNRHGLSGAWLAVSIWLKLYTAVVAWLMVWRACWRRALVGALIASMAVIALSVFAFGWQPVLSQPSIFSRITVVGGAFGGYPPDQNLGSLIGRWFIPNEYSPALVNAPQLASPIYWLLAAAFAVATLALLWPPGRQARPFELEAGLLIVTTHLLASATWYHHLAMIFIAFATLIKRWPDWRRPHPSMLLLGLAYALLAVQGLAWKWFVGYTLLLDLATWAEIIVWGLSAVQLRKHPASI
jgi:hypothetical protein